MPMTNHRAAYERLAEDLAAQGIDVAAVRQAAPQMQRG